MACLLLFLFIYPQAVLYFTGEAIDEDDDDDVSTVFFSGLNIQALFSDYGQISMYFVTV